MSQLTTLITGAGVQTPVNGLGQIDQFLVIGDVDTTNPIQGLQVQVGSQTFINLNSAALITAFAKWQMQDVGTVVGLMIKIATGRIKVPGSSIKFTNAGATTPIVYAYSTGGGGVPIEANVVSINATSYLDFDKFSALFVETPANIDQFEVVWRDGSKDTLGIQEMAALFALQNTSESNGYLGTVLVLDNRDQKFSSVRITTNSSGACSVAKAKLPQEAWDVLSSRNSG